jgi:hypothetical protein
MRFEFTISILSIVGPASATSRISWRHLSEPKQVMALQPGMDEVGGAERLRNCHWFPPETLRAEKQQASSFTRDKILVPRLCSRRLGALFWTPKQRDFAFR